MLTKIVNGLEVEMTQEEEASIKSEWAANSKNELDQSWLDGRINEYPSINDMTVAIWEKVMENRPQAADALQLKREIIKLKYPKPTNL